MSIDIVIQERERWIPLAEWARRGVARIVASPEKPELVGKHVYWSSGSTWTVEGHEQVGSVIPYGVCVLPLDPAALAAALASVPVVEPEGQTIDIQDMQPGDVGEYVHGCRFELGTLVQCVRFRSGTMFVLLWELVGASACSTT